MYIYYKNNLIAEAKNEIEKQELINIFIKERRAFYNQLYDRIDKFLKNLSKIRQKDSTESIEIYYEFLKKNYNEELIELELIGKEFFRKNYRGFYFQNSLEGYIGFYVETKGAYDCIPISVLMLRCCREIPIVEDFEISKETY